MSKTKQDKACEEAISKLGNNFIFEVSAEPIAPEDRFENWELSRSLIHQMLNSASMMILEVIISEYLLGCKGATLMRVK